MSARLVGFLSALVTAGCASGTLAPSLDVAHAPLVDRLPGDTTLWGGLNLHEARALPGYATVMACAKDRDSLLEQFSVIAGTPIHEDTLDAVVLGCGGGGCVGGALGDLQDVSLTSLAQHAQGVTVAPGGNSQRVDGTLPRGESVRLQRVDAHTLLAGDVAAVDGVGPHRQSLAALVDVIPRGQAWAAAVDAPTLFAQAAARLERNGGEGSTQLATSLRQESGAHRHVASMLNAVAVSLDVTAAQPALRLRLVCKGLMEALMVTTELSAALATQRSRPQALHAMRVALHTAQVVRVGHVVEVTAALVPCGENAR